MEDSEKQQDDNGRQYYNQRERITVTYPLQRFQPAEYCSMGVGDVSYTTFIQPGETFEQAWERAFEALRGVVKNSFHVLKKDFEDRYAVSRQRPGSK